MYIHTYTYIHMNRHMCTHIHIYISVAIEKEVSGHHGCSCRAHGCGRHSEENEWLAGGHGGTGSLCSYGPPPRQANCVSFAASASFERLYLCLPTSCFLTCPSA